MRYFWCFAMPWIAVLLCKKSWGLIFVVSLLTLCFWIPGVVVALMIVMQTEAEERQMQLIGHLQMQNSTPMRIKEFKD